MADKCLCCPLQIAGEPEYWYHLITYHKIDGEIANNFAAQRSLFRIMSDCFETLKCVSCSLPFIDSVKKLGMSQTKSRDDTKVEDNGDNKKSPKRKKKTKRRKEHRKNSNFASAQYPGVLKEACQHIDKSKTKSTASETLRETRPISESCGTYTDWSISGCEKDNDMERMMICRVCPVIFKNLVWL